MRVIKRNIFFKIILGVWFVLTGFLIYVNFPLISANLNYYFGKDQQSGQKVTQNKNNGTQSNNKKDNNQSKVEPSKVLENKIIIPKINVDAPLAEAASNKEQDMLLALQGGVVFYPTNSRPGEKGNVFVVGHSSNYRWAKGDYNYVFSILNKISESDLITIYYNGTKYVYKVFEVIVVSPKEVSVLNQTKDSIISVMTCDPPGTAWKRRIVKGIQIEPDPNKNKDINSNTTKSNGQLVGN
ncbi:hypothetical protein AUJ93_02155 [bacterium CG2_30_33_46]|nr:MAG: hypothetical protein AUJ93_02155 [bacterium CG2_30_33_46]